MEPHGTRLTLRITDPLDLNRDVLKVQLQLLLQYWILKSYSEIVRTGSCGFKFFVAIFREEYDKFSGMLSRTGL